MRKKSIAVYSVMQNEKTFKIVNIVCIVAMLMAMVMVSAFAEDGDATGNAIQAGVLTGTAKVYGIITAVVRAIATLAFVAAALNGIFGGDKGMEKAKKAMLTTLVVMALVWLGPLIVDQFSSWFSNAGTGTVFSTTGVG